MVVLPAPHGYDRSDNYFGLPSIRNKIIPWSCSWPQIPPAPRSPRPPWHWASAPRSWAASGGRAWRWGPRRPGPRDPRGTRSTPCWRRERTCRITDNPPPSYGICSEFGRTVGSISATSHLASFSPRPHGGCRQFFSWDFRFQSNHQSRKSEWIKGNLGKASPSHIVNIEKVKVPSRISCTSTGCLYKLSQK